MLCQCFGIHGRKYNRFNQEHALAHTILPSTLLFTRVVERINHHCGNSDHKSDEVGRPQEESANLERKVLLRIMVQSTETYGAKCCSPLDTLGDIWKMHNLQLLYVHAQHVFLLARLWDASAQ